MILLLLLVCTLSACRAGGVEPITLNNQSTNTGSQKTSPQTTNADAAQPEQNTQSQATNESTHSAVLDETNKTDTSTAQESTPTLSQPQFDPATVSLSLELVTSGLSNPVYVTHAGDGSGRLFVVEQPGTIRIIAGGQLLPEPFLNITNIVNDSANEQGLLGLAFAPDYASSGIFFVNYTNSEGDTTVARWLRSTIDPNFVDPNSQTIVMTIPQPAGNHNGGMITFGPDGYLYIGTGDGGAANDRFGNGQNPNTLLGKMLRIDVTSDSNVPYTIPADNPWVNVNWQKEDGTSIDVRDEIWAVGLRNPWRYSFDRVTNDLWLGDVGQNKFEEIHFTPSSALAAGNVQPINYGWPIMEGTHCFSPSQNCDMADLVQPVAEYDHSGHCSVTGGYVYRGQRFAALDGIYLYGDYCSGDIWAVWPQDDGTWGNAEVMRSDTRLSSFGEDEAGELYVADRTGDIYLVVAN